jgi:hypothetical protein
MRSHRLRLAVWVVSVMGLCAWLSAESASNVTAVDCDADSNVLTQVLLLATDTQ